MTVNANVTVDNPDLTHLPTAEEYALFREAYAETYPVRPLMNAIDAKDAEIARLKRARREAHVANLVEQRRVEAENKRLIERLTSALDGVRRCTNYHECDCRERVTKALRGEESRGG